MKLILFMFLAIFFIACGDDTSSSPKNCPDTCPDHSTCNQSTGVCDCDNGYHLDGDVCVEDSVTDPCEGVTCSGHGDCVENNGVASCECEEGYFPDNLQCVEGTSPCEGITCSNHGTCVSENGSAVCVCDEGYKPFGTECVTLCTGIDCPENSSCEESTGECICNDGYYYQEIFNRCELDNDCVDVECGDGEYCLSGECFLENECSSNNPDGVCPIVEDVQLICSNGLCISPNSGDLAEGEVCNPTEESCVEGTVCTDIFGDGRFKCRAFCDLTQNLSCGNEGVCAPYLDDYSRYTGICIKSDPECLNETDCPEGFECEMMVRAEVCKPQGLGGLDDSCDNDLLTDLDGCNSGLFCVGDEDDGEPYTCVELCDPLASSDSCQNGRCIEGNQLDPSFENSEIGLCIDIPYTCDLTNGITNNPDCPEDGDICVPIDNGGVGFCESNECTPEDSSRCAENESCTLYFTGVYKCLQSGDLELGDTGCINPEGIDQNLPAESLCQEGLICVGDDEGACSQACNPSLSVEQCPDGMACIDVSRFSEDYPEGVAGICGPEFIPDTCTPAEGIQSNPSCEEDSICFPIGDGNGICDQDMCENDDQCVGDKACTRTASSKNHCIYYGFMEWKDEGCVNPELNPMEELTFDVLCKPGLYCTPRGENSSTCEEYCDPEGENTCSGELSLCVDIHTVVSQIPEGLNGICVSPFK